MNCEVRKISASTCLRSVFISKMGACSALSTCKQIEYQTLVNQNLRRQELSQMIQDMSSDLSGHVIQPWALTKAVQGSDFIKFH